MEVKGTAVIAIRDFVKRNYPAEYKKWLDSLSPEAKKIFSDTIDSTKWYPVEAGAKEPTEKISTMFFNGNIEAGALEAGRFSAEKALTGIYKIFVKAANPQYIIKRASRVFATYYRPCEINVVDTPVNGVVVEMNKITDRYSVIEHRIVGWMEMALQISGCQDVRITNDLERIEADGKVVKFDMRWN
jgi:hypothetical protein